MKLKVVEATVDESLFGALNALGSSKGLSRKKLIQDVLYYERKIMRLLRRLQSISEGAGEIEELRLIQNELKKVASNLEDIEASV